MTRHKFAVTAGALVLMVCSSVIFAFQNQNQNLASMDPQSELRGMIERYAADRSILSRSYPVAFSPMRAAGARQFHSEWLATLRGLDFNALSRDGRIDYILFKNLLDYELRQLEIQARSLSETAPYLTFGQTIIDLEESRRRMESIDSRKAADTLTRLNKQILDTRRSIEADAAAQAGPLSGNKKQIANRAAGLVDNLREALRNWNGFYSGYDPMFSWWMEVPYKTVDQTLDAYGKFIRERIVGLKPGDSTDILGDPIGREALIDRAGLGDDSVHSGGVGRHRQPRIRLVRRRDDEGLARAGLRRRLASARSNTSRRCTFEPDKQTALILEQTLEAIDFVEKHDLSPYRRSPAISGGWR